MIKTKQELLNHFSDINEMYNNPFKYQTLSNMLDELLEQQPCEDCISREEAVYVASGYCAPQNIADELRKLPSVTPRTKSEEAIHAQGFVEGVKACIEKLNEMGG